MRGLPRVAMIGVLGVCSSGVGAVSAAGSAETPAYLGAQARFTLDSQSLADRASVGVNVANGNLVVAASDVRIAGRGLGVSLSRTYNGRGGGVIRTAGRDWVMSLGADNTLAAESDGDRTWRGPTGEEYRFNRRTDGTFDTAPGSGATLVENTGGTALLTLRRTGTVLSFSSASPGRLTTVTDRNGNHIDFTYGASGVSSITDTQGRSITFTYWPSGDLNTITDPTGRTWSYAYDTDRRLTSYTDPEGKVWGYHYDGAGRLDEITDPRTNKTIVGYDTTDRVTSVTRRVDGTTTNDVTTTYAYPAVSAPCVSPAHSYKTVVTDPRGHATTYCADAARQVTRVKNALNQEATRAYTPNGDISDFTDLVGTGQPPQTVLNYSSATNNLTGGTLGAGELFSQKFCGDSGEPTCSTLGFPTAAFAPTRIVDTEGSDTLLGYDSHGNVTDVKDAPTPRNKATLTYNPDGTLASATDGRGNATTFSYFTTPAVQAGSLKTITPPATSGPAASWAPEPVDFTYDTLGRVKTVSRNTGPSTTTITYTYDKLDRVKSISHGSGSVQFSYDGNGNLTQRVSTVAANGTTNYGHDALNRRTSEAFPGGEFNNYGYDKSSNLTSIQNSIGANPVTYTYDQIDRVKTITSPGPSGHTNDTVTYTYTDSPTPTAPVSKVLATYPGGATGLVEVNASGRPTLIEAKTASGTLLSRLTYSYLAGSVQRAAIQEVTDGISNRTTRYTYRDTTIGEDVGRLLKTRVTDSVGNQVEQWEYSHDETGNRTRKTYTGPTGPATITSYAYNSANQLCWVYTGTSTNACAAAPSGATELRYNGAGDQTYRQGLFIQYDAFGRFEQFTGGGDFHYGDHTNNELEADGGDTYHNSVLGLTRISTSGGAFNVVRDPATGAAVSETYPAAGGQPAGKHFFIQDAIGSTTGLLEPASGGTIARKYSYDPDGTDTTTGTGASTQLRFAGGHLLSDLALYHFGARYYDPSVARWTQQDPLHQVSDLTQANRYTYVGGDPINNVDPAGAFIINPEDIAGGIKRTLRDKLGDLGLAGQKAINEIAYGCTEGVAGSVIAYGIGNVFAGALLKYNPYVGAGSCAVGVGRRLK